MPSPLSFALNGHHTTAYTDNGSGPAVVFVHEMGFDHSVWDAVIDLMPAGLRLVTFDLRGHGASATQPAPYAMGTLIRDAEALLDHLALSDCVFVGSGIGGMIAQGLAVKRLDQIRALVLANTAPRISTKERWEKSIADIHLSGLEPRLDTDLALHFTPSFRKSGAIAPWKTQLAQRQLDGALGCAAAIAGTDFYTTTASLRLPSLVIGCDQDAITPADMVREMAELIPAARFDLIRKSGHMPMIEAAQDFATAVTTFLHDIGHR